jgi:hypothetical protein
MAVTFQLPTEIEATLRRQLANLDQAAKEALLVEMYRQHKLTHHQLAKALGLSRTETDGLLKRHEVFLEMTAQDVAREAESLHQARDDNGRKPRAADLTPAQRAAAWQEMVAKWRDWARANLPPGHVVDDSRESIYEGRGE